MAGHDRAQHHVFGKFLGFRFDHQHRIGCPGDDEIEGGILQFLERRVELRFAIDIADARPADRPHEGNAGERERRRGRDHRDNVGIVFEIMRENRDDDLRIVAIAVGKKRPDRAINQAGDQRLLFRGTTFALEIAARDAAGGEGFLLIVHGKGEEVHARFWRLGRDDGGEHGGLAVGRKHGAVGLARHSSGFEHELAPGPFEFFTMNIKHLAWSFSSRGKDPRPCARRREAAARQRLAILPWRLVFAVRAAAHCRRIREQSALALRNIKAFPQRARIFCDGESRPLGTAISQDRPRP